MKKLVPLLLLLLSTIASAQSFVSVTASKIFNGSNGLLSSGTISFQAVGANQQPISYQVGGGGQQILFPTICAIQNGAIIGTCNVANVLVALPQMLCFSVTVNDASNQVVLGGPGSGYNCVQPTPNSSWCVNSTCDFDNFSPNLPNNITVSFPFPSATNIGGVFSDQCSSGNVANGIFPTGHLSCTPGGGGGGGGNVSNSGTPVAAQLAQWVDAFHVQGINASGAGSVALTGSPVFTGTPTAPTPGPTDNSTTLATTAFVKAQGYAVLASLAPSATVDTTNAANISSGVLANGRIPTPSATTLGGVESLAAPVHTFFNSLSINGVFGSAQPACGDLSNAAASCSTDATNASNIGSGTLPLARLPLQGTGSKALSSSTVNGATGSELCTDATGAATTVGCTAGGGNVNNSGTPANTQIAQWIDATHIQGIASVVATNGGTGSTTAPTSGQIPVGNVGGTAYVPQTISGDGTLSSTGALSVTKTGGVVFAASATTNALNASNISSGTLGAARLPTPTSSTLGGIESIAQVSHLFVSSISTLGVPTATQPICSDLANAANSCSVDATNAANISSGTLPLTRLPLQGTGSNVLSSGTVSGTGAELCTDATGAATTVGCVAGGGNLSNSGTPTANQIGQFVDATHVQGISSIPAANGGTGSTTVPASGNILVGNAGGTAYAPVAVSGDATLSSSGAISVVKTGGLAFAASATTNTTNASNITSGTLPHAQLPALVSGDIPNNAANTTGTAANLSGTPALPNGTTATTQVANDTTTKLATDAFVTNQASATTPLVNGTAAIGTSLTYARADHVHPTDATRAPVASPNFTGTVTLPITGSTQCLHVSTLGVVSGTGADCGAGGGGSMTWPASAGVAVYSGSNSWSASLTVGGAANNLLAFDSSDNITMPGNATVGGQVIIDQPFEVNSTLPASAMASAAASNSKVGFDTDGKLKVSENAGTVTEVAKVNSNITGNASTATALAATPTQCTGSQFATGISVNGNANCATPTGGGGGGGGSTVLTGFESSFTGTSAMSTITVNSTELWGALLPGQLTTSNICYYLQTADNSSTDMYDLGIYDANGNLVAHTGAVSGATFGTSSGGRCIAFSSSGTISTTMFFIALTGTAATMKIGGQTGSALTQFCSGCAAGGTSGATTGGALNTTITPPTLHWAMNTSQQVPNISLF